MASRYLYVFLDEAGNFDFSTKGTKYLVISSVTVERPFGFELPLSELQYDLIQQGLEIEYFHAAEDRQTVRDRVFEIVSQNLATLKIDSVIVEKRKTGPALRPVAKLYPKMLGYLLRYVLDRNPLADFSGVVVITDAIPVRKMRRAVEKAVKMTLAAMLPPAINYRLLHHDSKSHFGLQVADYCNWAIYRKWANDDTRSYNLIRTAVRSEFDIFRKGERFYY